MMASVIMFTMVLPWFSWSNPTGATILEDERFDPLSGFGMMQDLFDAKVSGAPLLYILLYGITMLIFFGVISDVVSYLLIGINAWKPKNMLGIRRHSQTVLILFGINFLLQFMRYVGY